MRRKARLSSWGVKDTGADLSLEKVLGLAVSGDEISKSGQESDLVLRPRVLKIGGAVVICLKGEGGHCCTGCV